ncbi:hypothetical protein P3X46_032340 [Hevea brasiliensis]|uniref:DUF4220 domain-containing protein n=1 Tax=Hevea brasiliensis TaxID=3981 RepID=A0ABQ9KEY5_HEVBR|nr:hypothetical protein P3X46_032340 [Hevea brasiliensis]
MADPIPERVKKIWEHWNIRGALMFSLLLQILLIFFAPFRKRTARKLVIMMIWSGYLLADATANFAVGLISNVQSNSTDNSDLLAFWAPFLLLHLGGPDTITAVATGYVFVQTLPKNKVMIPTFLLFLAGIIKYLERTRSLYLASMDRFRDSMLKEPDPGPNYAKLMEEYASKKQANLPTQIIMIAEPEKGSNTAGIAPKIIKLDGQLEVVQKAYGFFKIFKGLIVDLIFSFKERNDSREFFNSILAEDALRVIETELNFIYEVLFTKVVVVQSKWGYFFRVLSFSSVVSALAVFHFHVKKQNFDGLDVGISYALLFGAIGLDTISLFMAIFSDWRAAALKTSGKVSDSCWKSIAACFKTLTVMIFRKFLSMKSLRWDKIEPGVECTVLVTPLFFRRWSGRISGHNLIRYCLKGRPNRICTIKKHSWCYGFIKNVHQCVVDRTEKIIRFTHMDTPIEKLGILKDKVIDFMGLKDFVDEIIYVSIEPFTKELWEFIFTELQKKSLFADDPETAKRICSARGDWVLQDNDSDQYHGLMPYVSDVAYDQSLLLWHVATELLYNKETDANPKSYSHREFCKILSDYMLYLLIMQPTIMAAVAGIGKIRFRDTCAEADRFFKRKGLRSNQEKEACKSILAVNTEVKPIAVKGDRSKSVLFDGSMLAQELDNLEKKWEILSKVWVELLSYAASHCRANAHAQQISKGGELITLVWLLMAHFGLGDQFQINEGHARAKLIVGK